MVIRLCRRMHTHFRMRPRHGFWGSHLHTTTRWSTLGTPLPSGTCLTEDLNEMNLESDGGESNKITQQRPRHNLGGAGKKRLKRLLAQGVLYEEAVVKAKHTTNAPAPSSFKWPHNEDAESKVKKQKKDPKQGPSYSEMVSYIRMAVTHKDFPEVVLTNVDMDHIKSSGKFARHRSYISSACKRRVAEVWGIG